MPCTSYTRLPGREATRTTGSPAPSGPRAGPPKNYGLRTCRSAEHLVTVDRLATGRAFHGTVQSAFLTDLTGATGFRERGWRLAAGGRGRVDLAVVTDDREKMLVIIEIKGTDWNKIRTGRVKPNVQRHIRQLLAYLDTAISELEAGQWEGVAGALLYPSRPASPETLACIQSAADEQAIMMTWYDETDWRSQASGPQPGPSRGVVSTTPPAAEARIYSGL
jgi:hypothetical protein